MSPTLKIASKLAQRLCDTDKFLIWKMFVLMCSYVTFNVIQGGNVKIIRSLKKALYLQPFDLMAANAFYVTSYFTS